MAYIGEPQKEIVVEPLQLPEPLRQEPEPERVPETVPEEPEKEPVHV